MSKQNTKFLMLFLTSIMISCSNNTDSKNLLATIKTNKGTIVLDLFYEKAPLTVSNFVGLATGVFAKDNENITKKGNYYDGLKFHRVVSNFVIQGGDPQGNGTGGPGYEFLNEIHPELLHNKKGILSMANAGPDTNGSQFFITLDSTPHLDGGYSVFGIVKEGLDVVDQIQEGDIMETITISAKKNSKAEAFLQEVSWKNFQTLNKKHKKNSLASTIKLIENETPKLTKTKDGIFVYQIKIGSGEQVNYGDTVETHYQLRLYGSEDILDDSLSRNQTFEFQTGKGSVIQGWDIIIQTMRVGDKIRAIIPPDLGYGSNGIQGTIPGNAFLDFTIELVSIK